MAQVFWDASGLVKRFSPESGTETVDALWNLIPSSQMVVTILGYAETFSVLLRKYHREMFDAATFIQAQRLLKDSVLNAPDFRLIDIQGADIMAGLVLMQAHHINTTDAAILAAYLRVTRPEARPVCLLVASDQRLLRAASAEGFAVLDPEKTAPEAVPALLQSLP